MTRDELLQQLAPLGWSGDALDVGLRANFRCEYCNRDLLASCDDYDSWQTDHIVPVARGGVDDLSNYALSCKACNFIKRHSVPNEPIDPVRDRRHAIEEIGKLIRHRRAAKEDRLKRIRALIESSGLAPLLGASNSALQRTGQA